MSESIEFRERESAAVFGIVGALILSVLYLLARSGFGNPLFPVVVTLGVALFIICVPLYASTRLSMDRVAAGTPEWWKCQPFLSLVAIALTALAGASADRIGAAPSTLIVALGVSAAVWVMVRWFKAIGLAGALAIIGSASLFFGWAGGVAWSSRHKHPLFQEALATSGNVHHDALFNSAVGNMIQAYGIPSTGVDGVPYIPYHYGASWLHAQWADLAALDLLSFYNLGPTVVMIPVFGFALLLFVVEVRAALRRRGRAPVRPLELDYVAGGALLAGTIGVIPSTGLTAMGIWNTHVLISESYTTGLPVFLFVAALLLVFHDSGAIVSGRRPSALFLLVALPLMLAALGFLKVSLMILTLGAVGWTALRQGLWRDTLVVAAAGISVITAVGLYFVVSLPSQNQGVVPLAFMRSSIEPGWWIWFPFVHLFWSWVYVVARAREEGVRTSGDLVARFRDRRLLDAELVAAIAVTGFIPGLVLEIHGGSAFYFSDVQRWIALPLVMAMGAGWLARPQRNPDAPSGIFAKKQLIAGMRLSNVALVLLALPLLGTALRNATRAQETALRQNLTIRRDVYALAGVVPPVAWRYSRDEAILRTGLQHSPRYRLVSALRTLDDLPRAQKRITALFIPQSDSIFWNLLPEPERCSIVSLAAPALSGMAMIDGMPPAGCGYTDQYAFGFFSPRRGSQTEADVTDASVCTRAVGKGFLRVVRLESGPVYRLPSVDCARR